MHTVNIKIVIYLLILISFSNGFSLYGLRNTYKYLLQEINSTLGLTFDSSSITTEWIEQPLDHFNQDDNRTWRMRYFQRLDKWRKGGPIYLFINGEAEANNAFLQTGVLYELAKETNGAMFLSEHRYYGKSIPLEEFRTENLKYLSSKQALADNANLLKYIRFSPKYNASKVVVVGGSYAGNLAAWMRLLYPDLVNAGIASSGPVMAKLDFHEYLENVHDDYEQHGTPDCIDNILKIFSRYDMLFKTADGIEQLKRDEIICDDTDMTKKENQQLFFLDKTSEFMHSAQYGTPKAIEDHCEDISETLLINSDKNEEIIWNKKNSCFDYDFDNMIDGIREVLWYMSWTYQTCTEFSYFPSTSSNKHAFTDNIHMELFYKWCTSLFGPEFDKDKISDGVQETNNFYGGLKPNVTKVIFVNGDLDPWHRLGVLEDISYDAPAKVIPHVSHCRDLFSNRRGDPQELREARRYVKYLIKKWIGAGDFRNPEYM